MRVHEDQGVDEFSIVLDILASRFSEVEYEVGVFHSAFLHTANVVAFNTFPRPDDWDATFGIQRPDELTPHVNFILLPNTLSIGPILVTIRNEFLPEPDEEFELRIHKTEVLRKVFECYNPDDEPVEGNYFCSVRVIIEDDDGKDGSIKLNKACIITQSRLKKLEIDFILKTR